MSTKTSLTVKLEKPNNWDFDDQWRRANKWRQQYKYDPKQLATPTQVLQNVNDAKNVWPFYTLFAYHELNQENKHGHKPNN